MDPLARELILALYEAQVRTEKKVDEVLRRVRNMDQTNTVMPESLQWGGQQCPLCLQAVRYEGVHLGGDVYAQVRECGCRMPTTSVINP